MSHINNTSTLNTNGKPQDFFHILDAVVPSFDTVLKTDENLNSSPNMFNNINVFDVLTPQVHNIQNCTNVKEGVLIDITNDTDYNQNSAKIEQSFTSNELRGSLADMKKTEFNLIDLYENIYVTPQHVAKKQLYTNSTTEIRDLSYMNYVPVDNYNKCRVSDGRSEKEHENIFRNTCKPLQYDEIFDKVVFSKHTSINSDNDKLRMAQNNAPTFKSPSFNAITDMRKNNTEDLEDLMQDIQNCNKTMYKVPMKIENPKIEVSPHKLTDFAAHNLKFEKLYQYSSSNAVDTVKKGEKTAKNKKIPSQNPLSSNLTKGPDLFEKSVVLPQIMERIAERNKRMIEKINKDLRRKLILDSGNVNYDRVGTLDLKTKRPSRKISHKTREDSSNMLSSCSVTTDIDCPVTSNKTGEEVTLNPTVVMENSKIVRLAALEARRKFETFVRTGKYD